MFIDFLDLIIDFANNIFGLLGIAITEFSSGGGSGLDYMEFVHEYRDIFTVFAYAFMLLFFGINVINTSMTQDLFTARGGAKVLGQLLFGYVLISASGVICTGILDIANYITDQIISIGITDLTLDSSEYTNPFSPINIPIIGEIVNFIMAIIYLIPTLLMLVAVIITAFCVECKLIMRTFQIGVLITVSPPFFACLTADATRDYFKRWLNSFLSTACEVIFMALIYAMGTSYLTHESFFTDTAWSLVAISMCVMMVKPPAFLKNLVS
jgi:type IV secretory pathway VirB6-like protein